MSCWVVPTLAAELWRMPLEQVLKLMRDGCVPTKQEEGFTFIDVAPDSPKLAAPLRKPEQRPPTFIPAADEQDVEIVVMDDDLSDLQSDEESSSFGDWRAARQRISLTRVGPARRRPAA